MVEGGCSLEQAAFTLDATFHKNNQQLLIALKEVGRRYQSLKRDNFSS
jgi:hypothetical protein